MLPTAAAVMVKWPRTSAHPFPTLPEDKCHVRHTLIRSQQGGPAQGRPGLHLATQHHSSPDTHLAACESGSCQRAQEAQRGVGEHQGRDDRSWTGGS